MFGYSQCAVIESDSGARSNTVETFDKWEDLYRFQTYYISAQPEEELLEWLKDEWITKIVNLRTKSENKEFSKENFNEEKMAKKLGIDYASLPIDGSVDYTPENLEQFMKLVDPGEKILIHCASGGRANNFFMAYLIKEEGYDVNRVVEIGKQIHFSMPFETILGAKIKMEIVE